jgi:HEAT repeat protein
LGGSTTVIQGSVEKLVQIRQVIGTVSLFGPDVAAKLSTAIEAQAQASDELSVREAAARVMTLLDSKRVLTADVNDELWSFAFQSLHQIRQVLVEAGATLSSRSTRQVRTLVDLMIAAVRDYLDRYETSYERHMGGAGRDWDRESRWPRLGDASRDLLVLRALVASAGQPLRALIDRDGETPEDNPSAFHVQRWKLARAVVSAPEAARALKTSASAAEISALRHGPPWMRLMAAEFLARSGDSGAAPTLLEMLEDDDEFVTQVARAGLVRHWRPTREALRQLSRSPVYLKRLLAVERLGATPRTDDVDIFLEALEDSYRAVRDAAEAALVSLGPPIAPILARVIESGSSAAQTASLKVLREMRTDLTAYAGDLLPALRGALATVEPDQRWAVPEVASHIRTPASFSLLLDTLDDSESVAKAGRQALFGLLYDEDTRETAVGRLSDALPQASDRAAVDIIELLHGKRSARAAGTILEAFDDSRVDVRRAAVRGFAENADYRMHDDCPPGSAGPLLLRLEADVDPGIRSFAVQALGRFCHQPAIPALIEALSDADESVRRRAIEALERLKAKPAVPNLIPFLNDEDWTLRCAAIEALVAIEDPTAGADLCGALADPNEYVRREALRGTSLMPPALAIAALTGLLTTEDHNTQRSIIGELGRLAVPEAVPLIRPWLLASDHYERTDALQALHRIPHHTAVDAIEGALSDEDDGVRTYAVAMLGHMGSIAEEALDRASTHPDPSVRKAVEDVRRRRRDATALKG